MRFIYLGIIPIFLFVTLIVPQFLNNSIITYVGDEIIINCNLAKENESIEENAYWEKGDKKFKHLSNQEGNYIILIEPRQSFSEDLEVRSFQLLIKNISKSDSGTYVCYYNGRNRTTITLNILEKPVHEIIISNSGISDNLSTPPPLYTNFSLNINVTECCVAENVSLECQSSCVGKLGLKESCRPYVDKIDMCIINGKDHTSCCKRRFVPDACLDLCTHALSDTALANLCASHFPEILQCIEEGHYSLPSPPRYITAETINETALAVSWSPPASNVDLVKEYYIVYSRLELPSLTEMRERMSSSDSFNLGDTNRNGSSSNGNSSWTTQAGPNTTHEVFSVAHDPDSVVFGISYDSLDNTPKMILPSRNESRVVVPAGHVKFILVGLIPGSAYEIYMQALSAYGSSLPSDIVEAFTRSKEVGGDETHNQGPAVPSPQRPKPPAMTHASITKCCTDAGIPDTCLPLLCQIHNLAANTSQALIMCARHFEIAMKCIIDGRNHTSCCIKNRISPWCYGFCDGTSDVVSDFREANCLVETAQILTCIIQGHEILPSEPRNLRSLFKNDHLVTLSWGAPDRNKDMVTSYSIYYRESSPYETPDLRDYTFFTQVANVSGTAYQLDDLHGQTWYEIFVVADAMNGSSLPSASLKILTPQARVGDLGPGLGRDLTTVTPPSTGVANDTADHVTKARACCARSHVDERCMPLCAYDIDRDRATALLPQCPSHLQSVLTCLADERDHTMCCASRDVPLSCLSFCSARLPTDLQESEQCISYSFQILQCFESGIRILPSSPQHLFLANRSSESLSLAWEPPAINPQNVSYYIKYSSDSVKQTSVSTTGLNYTINNLLPNTTYRLYLEAINSFGSSLPTYVILVKTMPTKSTKRPGTSKPTNPFGTLKPSIDSDVMEPQSPPRPNEIEVLEVGTEYLTLAWKASREGSSDKKDWIYRVYYTEVPDPLINETNVTDLVAPANPSFHSINVTEPHINLTNLTPNGRYKIFITSDNHYLESLPSETIIVRAAQKAAPQATIVVSPSNPVQAGKTVVMRCLTTGIPEPQITWYHWLDNFQQPIWHEENFTMTHLHRTAMGQYKCVARNGILPNGKDFVHLKVAFSPLVMAKNAPVFGNRFGTIKLNCTVEAYPPIILKSALWYKDGKLLTRGDPTSDHQSWAYQDDSGGNKYTYIMSLVIKNIQLRDFGSYVCQASNKYGIDKDTIEVRQRDAFDPLNPVPVKNVSECCERLNVQDVCMPACYYDANLDNLLQSNHNRLMECVPELSKIVHCAADGRDHSICCDKRNVPGQCRRFCQGKLPPLSTPYLETCLGYAKTIIDCFYNGTEIIPTVPTNVRGEVVHDNEIKLRWDPPEKYPKRVQYYTVFYRSSKEGHWKMKRVTAPTTRFTDLDHDTLYYFQVMAGNTHGSSHRSSIITFSTGIPEPVYHRVHKNSKPATLALGFIGATLLASILGLALYILYKKRFSHLNHPVSFDNPGYEKEHVLDDMNPSPFTNGFGGTLGLVSPSKPTKVTSTITSSTPYSYGNIYSNNSNTTNNGTHYNNRRSQGSPPEDPLNGVSGWHLPSLHASSSSSSSPPSGIRNVSGSELLVPALSPPPPSSSGAARSKRHAPGRSGVLAHGLDDDDVIDGTHHNSGHGDDDAAAILQPSLLHQPYPPSSRERMIT